MITTTHFQIVVDSRRVQYESLCSQLGYAQDRARVAKIIGVDRTTLWRRLQGEIRITEEMLYAVKYLVEKGIR